MGYYTVTVWWKCSFQMWKSHFLSLQTSPASVCHLSSYRPPASPDHLGAGCDCTAMFIAPGWPDPIPAKTDMATASAAWTLSPLIVGPGLETEVGGEGPCWMTAAGEPVASGETSREGSSPPAATDREKHSPLERWASEKSTLDEGDDGCWQKQWKWAGGPLWSCVVTEERCLLLHYSDRAVFVGEEELLQLCHFIPQKGYFILMATQSKHIFPAGPITSYYRGEQCESAFKL